MGLRPDITIEQIFQSQAPVVPTPNNPGLIIGLARQLVWRGEAGSFTGGITNPLYEFPGLLTDATLIRHTDTTVDERLLPKVEISTAYGVEDVTASATFNYLVAPPTIDIPDGLSVTATVATGTGGTYDETTGIFSDASATFIDSGVVVGATVQIDGVDTFLVAGVPSQTELEVTLIDKGSGLVEGALGVVAAGSGVITSAGADFVTTGVKINDLLRVWGYETLDSVFGASYPGGAGAQTLTDTDADFSDAPAVADDTGAPTVAASLFDYVAVLSGSDRVPTFYVSGLPVDTTTLTVTPFVGTPAASTDTAYTVGRLGAAHEVATGVTAAGAWSVAGSVLTTTAGVAGQSAVVVGDVFCDTDAAGGGRPQYVVVDLIDENNFEIAPLYAAVTASGTGGFFRPSLGVFTTSTFSVGVLRLVNVYAQTINFVFATTGVPVPVVTVTGNEIDGFTVTATGTVATTVAALVTAINADATTGLFAYEVTAGAADAAIAATAVPATNQVRTLNGGGAYSAEVATVRTITTSGTAFTTTIAPAGSQFTGDNRPILKDQTGAPLFFVTEVVDDTTLLAVNVVSGTPASGATSSDFRFRVLNARDGLAAGTYGEARLTVLGITNLTTLSVANVHSSVPLSTSSFTSLPYEVTAPSVLTNRTFTITKAVTGSDLTGSVLVSFASNRSDIDTLTLVEGSPTSALYWKTLLGAAVSFNPLALGAAAFAANTNSPFYVLGVDAETSAAFQEALATAGDSETPYAITVLTQDPDVLSLLPAHVETLSDAENKRERIAYVSHALPVQETVAEFEAGDTGLVSVTKTALGTITITLSSRDITSVLELGQVFTATTTGLETFSGSITAFSAALPDTTSITITPTSDLSVGTDTLTAFTVETRELSLQEKATFMAAIPAGLVNRRIRQVYPASFNATFTDDTAGEGVTDEGFYGGGDVEEVLGGHYLTVQQAAFRTSLNPRDPASGRPTAGLVVSLIDPFKSSLTLQNQLIDAGTYYLEDAAPGSVSAIRAISTDTTDLRKTIDSFTVQIDNAARLLRRALRPLLARYAMDSNFLDLISARIQAVREFLLRTERSLKKFEVKSFGPSPSEIDTFLLTAEVDGFADGAKGRITFVI